MNFFEAPRGPVRQANRPAGRIRRFPRGISLPRVEALESRELLAASSISIGSLNDLSFVGSASDNNVTVSFDFGTLTYTISDTVDVINVFNGGTVSVNGNGTNTVTLQGVASQMSFDTGGGADTFNIQSINLPTLVTNTASITAGQTVNVGDASGVQHIQATLNVQNLTSLTALTIDDSGDTTAQSATLDVTNSVNLGSVTGLAPTSISFAPLSLSALSINGGSGGNSFTVVGTPQSAPTVLSSGVGDDNISVLATNGPLTIQGQGHTASGLNAVTLGGTSAGVQDLLGAVNVDDSAFSTNLRIDDSGNSLPETNVLISATGVTGLAPAAIGLGPSSLASLTILGGSGGNTYTVNTTPTSTGGGVRTEIDTGGGTNLVNVLNTSPPSNSLDLAAQVLAVSVPASGATTINIGDASAGLGNIGGNVSLETVPGSFANVTLDDSADTVGQSATLTGIPGASATGTLTMGGATITYGLSGLGLTLRSGSGANTVTLDFASGGGSPIPSRGLQYLGGTGANTLNLQGQSASGPFSNETYQASGPGAGSIDLDGSVVTFSGLTPINDTTPANNYVFSTPGSSSPPTVNITDGPVFNGTQTTTISDGSGSAPPAFELVHFGNKSNVTINVDPFSTTSTAVLLDNSIAAAGLVSMTINTGIGGVDDTSNVLHTPSGVAVSLNSQGGNDNVSVAFGGLGTGSGSSFQLNAGTGNDTLAINAAGASALSVSTPGLISFQSGTTPINYANYEQISIINAPSNPAVGGSAVTVSATEGQGFPSTTVGSFTNSDAGATSASFNASIDWGDGTTSLGTVAVDPSTPSGFLVSGSHTYDEEGTFTISNSVTNQGESGTTNVGGVPITISTLAGSPSVLSPASSATVADAPLLPGPPLNLTATQGVALAAGAVVATFTDTDPNGTLTDYSATIDWGDGSSQTPGTIVANGPSPNGPTFSVVIAAGGSHAYSGLGFFPLAVLIHDVGGSSTVVTDHVNVLSTLSSKGVTLTFSQGSTLPASTVVATFTTSNPTATTSDFNASIDWGDGSTSAGSIALNPNGGFEVLGGHTYASTGSFSITVDIQDSVGSSTTAFSTISGNGLSLIVTNTNDSGRGSLRQALANAAVLGGGTILFEIPTQAPYIVHVQTPLTVTVPVIIDTTSMLGGAKFVLDGGSASVPLNQHGNNPNLGTFTDTSQYPALLDVKAANSVVRGLGFVHYAGFGIALDFSSGHDLIEDNTIGTDETGSLAQGNTVGGILVLSARNVIGLPGHGNVISANGTGIYVSGRVASNNMILGNRIGANAAGNRGLGNELDGIAFDGASNNQIGGVGTGQGNFIAANGTVGSASATNGGAGIYLFNGSNRNVIQGNTIGAGGLGNVSGGILIGASSGNMVGGTVRGSGNTITGNSQSGVVIFLGSTANVLARNTIIRNGNAGVYVLNASRNLIGLPGAGNNLSANAFSGVVIATGAGAGGSATGNVVRGNGILENRQDGIYVLNASGNVIGGASGSGNLVRLNGFSGIEIAGAGSSGNVVLGNVVTDQSRNTSVAPVFGTTGFIQGGYGVLIQNASGNVVGGSGAGNVFRNNALGNILVVVRGRPVPGPSAGGNVIGQNTFLPRSLAATTRASAIKAARQAAAAGSASHIRHPNGTIESRLKGASRS